MLNKPSIRQNKKTILETGQTWNLSKPFFSIWCLSILDWFLRWFTLLSLKSIVWRESAFWLALFLYLIYLATETIRTGKTLGCSFMNTWKSTPLPLTLLFSIELSLIYHTENVSQGILYCFAQWKYVMNYYLKQSHKLPSWVSSKWQINHTVRIGRYPLFLLNIRFTGKNVL